MMIAAEHLAILYAVLWSTTEHNVYKNIVARTNFTREQTLVTSYSLGSCLLH